MRINYCLFILFFITLAPLQAQRAYQTDVMDKLVKTLQLRIDGQSAITPCIPLDGSKRVEINFDLLHDDYHRLAYTVVHCDADWKQSTLSPIEYMSGFQGLPVDDFANSMATTVPYANYKLLIPNTDVRFKISGNYAVKVYDEDKPDRTLLTACFSVYEPLVGISATISGNTDIDTNLSHQQLSFGIDYARFPIPYPQMDLKIRVLQNGRRDNAVSVQQPSGIFSNRVVYEHLRELIFEAGNEYRRMEFLASQYNGMHVERTEFHNPYYHVDLYTDLVRRNLTYQYDQDQNGRFVINCSRCSDPDTEADYYIVHFSLLSQLIPDGNLYLLSDIYNNALNEKSKMGYNPDTGRYEKSTQLKQGNYNYQYIFVPNEASKGTTGFMEGNYYQTENEYLIYVYYRPMSERYDRLIGVQRVSNQMKIGF